MPREADAAAVISALTASPKPMSTAALETVADVRRTRLELLLKVLDVEGAVHRVSGGWLGTGDPWVYDEERYARVAAARSREAELMLGYQSGGVCRMRFLQVALDDDSALDCGRCDVCAGAWYPTDVPDGAAQAAGRTLRKVGVEIDARSQWPSGMSRLGVSVSGKLAADDKVEPGRAIARLTDLGWGQRLRSLLGPNAADAPADERLLRACIEVLADWPWEQRPAAVVAVPSLRRPRLVDSVARHLATLGRLPFLGSPVLLVDDLVDSRWTITVAGLVLRQAGAPGVLPFALAVAA